jgi:diketogulonate reductase-like aldo/keto reductase
MSYKEGDDLFPKDSEGNFIDGGVDYLDTWRAMEQLVDSGLTKSIGVSNFNKNQVDRVVANGNFIFNDLALPMVSHP